jgi:hypothetical protein
MGNPSSPATLWAAMALRATLCVSLTALMTINATAAELTPLAERFRIEAPKAWGEYRTFAAELQGEVTSKAVKDGKEVSNCTYRLKQRPGCRLFALQGEFGRGPMGQVDAVNANYAFKIKRKGPESNWMITNNSLPQPDSAGVLSDDADRIGKLIETYTLAGLEVYNVSLPELVSKPEFRLVAARAFSADGRDLVEIDFETPHPLPGKGEEFYPVQSGTLRLDPERSWCIVSGTVKTLNSNSTSVVILENKYASGANAAAPLISAESKVLQATMTDGTPNYTYETVRIFNLNRPSSLPGEQEFTLSKYDLPEPRGLAPLATTTPKYLYFIAAGVLLFVLAAVLRSLARRQLNAEPT